MALASDKQREVCIECFKPRSYCICATIVPVQNKTDVTIIQHPKERTHPIGTVRIAKLALEKVSLQHFGPKEGHAQRRSRAIEESVMSRGSAALLYPGDDAKMLSDLGPKEMPDHIVVLDGTWSHARKLYHTLPWLQRLPKVMFHPQRPSEYRIRKEPELEFVSSIEAIYYALRIIEPENDSLENLLIPFRRLIDRQILRGNVQSSPRGIQRKQPRRRGWAPEAIRLNFENCVVCYCEYSMQGETSNLVSLQAQRLSDGETLELFIGEGFDGATAQMLELFELSQMPKTDLVTASEARMRWRKFLREDDILLSWNASTLRRLQQFSAPTTQGSAVAQEPQKAIENGSGRVVLKAVYANWYRQSIGHLHGILPRHGLHSVENSLRGRGANRIGNAIAIARFLRQTFVAGESD